MTEPNPEETPDVAGEAATAGTPVPPPLEPPPGGYAPPPPPPGGYAPPPPPPGGYVPPTNPPGGYAPPPGANWSGPATAQPGAPFGVDPLTGLPFSDKTKLIAGLLQILIPIGVGRMYMGHVGVGVAQLLVTIFTCGVGTVWPFIDGILILVGQPKDEKGLPLR